MKKTIAIVLSLVMLFGLFAINTFAATSDPTVEVITTAGSQVATGNPTYFTVKFSNFETIQGMDITITADNNATLIDEINVTGFGIAPVKGENYTFSTSQIHLVDLTGSKSGNIIFKATPSADAKITISGKYAKNGEELFAIDAANGNIEVVKEAATEVTIGTNDTTVEQPAANTNTFIPYGSVYKEEGGKIVAYADKDPNGKFTGVDNTYTAESFKIPAGGLGTFGASNKVGESKVKFGNYSNKNTTGTTHGTMIFEGDWKTVKEIYVKKGYTVEEIIKIFSDDYDTKKQSNPSMDYVYYNVNGISKAFRVYKFAQVNYMWKSGEVLEYAIALNNAQNNTNYTAVAYSINSGKTTLSTTVKSVTYTAQ